MKVIYEGKSYAASDSNNQESFPVPGFNLMQKGLLHIFKPIVHQFPDHDIDISWNEDEKRLSYSSNTLDQSLIEAAIKEHHAIEI
jgi:hypothetical protein